jgi:hypothetical protein
MLTATSDCTRMQRVPDALRASPSRDVCAYVHMICAAYQVRTDLGCLTDPQLRKRFAIAANAPIKS